MDTLTRVLARNVYGLEVNNLPLERITERRAIKRGTKVSGIESTRSSFARSWSSVRPDRQVETHAASSEGHVPSSTILPHLPEESHDGNPHHGKNYKFSIIFN